MPAGPFFIKKPEEKKRKESCCHAPSLFLCMIVRLVKFQCEIDLIGRMQSLTQCSIGRCNGGGDGSAGGKASLRVKFRRASQKNQCAARQPERPFAVQCAGNLLWVLSHEIRSQCKALQETAETNQRHTAPPQSGKTGSGLKRRGDPAQTTATGCGLDSSDLRATLWRAIRRRAVPRSAAWPAARCRH